MRCLEVWTRDASIMRRLVVAVINSYMVIQTLDRGPKKTRGEIEVRPFKILETYGNVDCRLCLVMCLLLFISCSPLSNLMYGATSRYRSFHTRILQHLHWSRILSSCEAVKSGRNYFVKSLFIFVG